MRVDLNADVGEWESDATADAALIPFITSANVACGVHAGNAEVMAATVELCRASGVCVGAHPSLNDRLNFGRREQTIGDRDVRALVFGQIRQLAAIASQQGVALRHVKPHGALYNMSARDRRIADAIAEAVAAVDPSLVLFGLVGSESIAAGRRAGLRTASEGFADRGYQPDGALVPRGQPGATLNDPEEIAARAVRMIVDGVVIATDGSEVALVVDTICIHGDAPAAPAIAQRVRTALQAAGVRVSAAQG